jgi:membrane protease YdiL (CAAX protease family)
MLAIESSSDSSSTPASQFPPSRGLPERIFLNDEGLRAGWSLLIYAAFCVMLEFAGQIIVGQFIGPGIDPYSPQNVLIEEVLTFASAYGAALLMAKLEKRPPDVYGLPIRGAFGKLFWQGVGLGFGEITLLIALITAFGGYSFGKIVMHGFAAWGWGFLWAAAFVAVGLSEEYLFRGYVQYTLARGLGFWPAAIALSLVFGAVHLTNPGEGPIGAASVAATGLVFAFALRRTGSLWLAVGWHASFDFGETFLFSIPNSGVVYDRHLSTAVLHGKPWLTGGTVGPEGSVFSFLILGVSALVIHLLFPAKKEKPAET